jgi:hypothetical protein
MSSTVAPAPRHLAPNTVQGSGVRGQGSGSLVAFYCGEEGNADA